VKSTRNTPRSILKRTAEEAREMHRLYPFTRTVSSAFYSHRQKTDESRQKKT
jgi:hypothetical protein